MFFKSFYFSPLIPIFESWLRLVMERDPKIRGGEKDQNGERECYRMAEKILSTKVHQAVFFSIALVKSSIALSRSHCLRMEMIRAYRFHK